MAVAILMDVQDVHVLAVVAICWIAPTAHAAAEIASIKRFVQEEIVIKSTCLTLPVTEATVLKTTPPMQLAEVNIHLQKKSKHYNYTCVCVCSQ